MNNWDINIFHYEFMASIWLWGLLLLPFLFYYLLKKERNRSGDWKFTGLHSDQNDLKNNSISWIRILLIFAKTSLLACLLIALAKPYSWEASETKNEASKYGIDIILAMDVSMSMLARDFNPNRLTVAKEVAKEFIDGRHGDRIGLVVYAGEAYTACPATLDYALLKGQVDKIDGSNLEPGTAIGTGLGTAVVQLRSDSLKSKVTGTFLSETGDYRYLAGNVDANNTLFLSTFDGVHAYQFVANIYSRDSIEGIFYSGASYNTVWKGRRNDAAQLTDPDSLSEMITHGALTFDAKTLNGKDFHFKAQENHPTIIQIMGTWCPNCMDEMNYFKEIYPKYKQNGVEIIAVSFEIGTHTKDQLKRLRQFKKRAEVPYKVLLGGSSTNKGEAAQVFKDLSKVMGFPTTIFIDEKGHVVKVHTGFSGPGTGIEFLKFKEETEQLLNKISGLQSPIIFD